MENPTTNNGISNYSYIQTKAIDLSKAGLVGKTVAAIHTVAFVRNATAAPKGGENG